jgi:hypothetical protein
LRCPHHHPFPIHQSPPQSTVLRDTSVTNKSQKTCASAPLQLSIPLCLAARILPSHLQFQIPNTPCRAPIPAGYAIEVVCGVHYRPMARASHPPRSSPAFRRHRCQRIRSLLSALHSPPRPSSRRWTLLRACIRGMQVVSEMAEGGIPIPSPSVRTYCGWHHCGGFARGRGWVVRPKVKARADQWAARGGLQGGRSLPRTMQGQIGVSPLCTWR